MTERGEPGRASAGRRRSGRTQEQPSSWIDEVRTATELARALRELRRREARRRGAAELTYRDLAARTGWSIGAIAQYLNGKVLPPTDRFDALVHVLGATPVEQRVLATARDRVEEHQRWSRPSGAEPAATEPAAAEPAAAEPVAVPATADVVPRQLPTAVPHFAGREDYLARLDAVLAAAGSASTAVVISAVSGTAGVGKTALAVHWAHRVAAERFPDGQLYVNLRGFDQDGHVMAASDALRGFLDALGVPPGRIPAGLDARTGLYRSLLAGRRMLVLLDNARDVEQVRPLLPGTASCVVLVTSRNQLTGLVAVDGAHPVTLDLFSPAEARALLITRLGVDRVAAEPDAVDRIVTGCARLPLALAIAAARAQQTGFALTVLAGELNAAGGRLDALDAGDAGSRIRAVFSWSYATLSSPAATLFRRLGLHPGRDISAEATAALVGRRLPETQRLLGELVRVNLLIEHLPGRYHFHDLLRAYATELVDTTDPARDRRGALGRLLDYYVQSAHAADRILQPVRGSSPLPIAPADSRAVAARFADHDEAMAWLTAEHQVLLDVVERAAATDFDAHAWQLAWAFSQFLDRRGHWHDLTDIWQAALRAARRLQDPAAQSFAHRLLGHGQLRLGRRSDAELNLRCALNLDIQTGDQVGQARAHQTLGFVRESQGELRMAIEEMRRALSLYQAAGHRRGTATALGNLGWFHAQLGDHAEALTHCEAALTAFVELGDNQGKASAWDSLGYVHHTLGDHGRAAECHQLARILARDLGDRYLEATTLAHLGDTHQAAGAPEAARSAWQEAVDILTELDHPDADGVRAKLRVLSTPDQAPTGVSRDRGQ